MPEVHKLSEPFKVGDKVISELQVQAPGGVLKTGLLLQLLGEFQAAFPAIYAEAKVKISEEAFLTLALAKFNNLTLQELEELPVTEWYPAVSRVLSFLFEKPAETKT